MMEILVVSGLIAGFATVSVPLVARLQRAQQFRSVTRNVQSSLVHARSVASSGKRELAWSTNDRVQQAGVFINSATSYPVFVDRDTVRDGDEITVRTVLLPVGMEITAPAAGQEIRFRHTGTVVAPQNITIADRYRAKSRTLILSGGGTVRIN
jgi:Tfp pilus assembly protein FimT